MKIQSSKPAVTLAVRLIVPASLFVVMFVQGCDSLALRDTIINTLDGDNLHTQLVISDNGAVLASGPVEKVARQSFNLAGVTFAVTGKTSMIDQSGAALALSDLEVGLGLEVDGTQHDDGTFEATFAEVADLSSDAAHD